MTEDKLRGFKAVRVTKAALKKALEANREKHQVAFQTAREGYKKAFIQALERNLALAREGKEFNAHVHLTVPVDHTSDYSRALKLLEFSEDEEFELSALEFDQYVMDQWIWSGQFEETVSVYSASS